MKQKKIRAWAVVMNDDICEACYESSFILLISGRRSEAAKVLKDEMNPPNWEIAPILITLPKKSRK